MSRKKTPEINTGSMADIAFLLLIFFLVTSVIPNDKGLHRKLPPPCPQNEDCPGNKTKERNILEVRINANDELLVENEMVSIEELKDIAKGYLDNNGDGTCDYCAGSQVTDLSENPNKAVISLVNDKMTTYKFYIKVFYYLIFIILPVVSWHYFIVVK